MTIFMNILFLFLLVCAVAVSFTKNLLNSILVYMSFSLVMALIWLMLESPDLAITEAAVGAGVTTVLFLVTLKKLYSVHTGKSRELLSAQQDVTVEETAAMQEASESMQVKEEGRTQEEQAAFASEQNAAAETGEEGKPDEH